MSKHRPVPRYPGFVCPSGIAPARGLGLVLLCVIAATLPCSGAAGDAPRVAVTNVDSGEVFRYPVVLLGGTIADREVKTVTAINRSDTAMPPIPGGARDGEFKVLVRLHPGTNAVRIQAGDAFTELSLVFLPQTNPYKVRAFWYTDRSGNTAFPSPRTDPDGDFAGRMATAMEIYQSFTADWMHEQGHGRRTFNVETDTAGRPVVHSIKGSFALEEYDRPNLDVLQDMSRCVQACCSSDRTIDLVFPAFLPWDPWSKGPGRGHIALQASHTAAWNPGVFFAWPRSVADAWACVSDPLSLNGRGMPLHPRGFSLGEAVGSSMGGALHELGHALGLPHSQERLDMLGSGDMGDLLRLERPPRRDERYPVAIARQDEGRWTPASAAWLAASRYLALDARSFEDGPASDCALDSFGDFVLTSHHGLRAVQLIDGDARAGAAWAPGDHPVPKVRISAGALLTFLHSPKGQLRFIDQMGNMGGIELNESVFSRLPRRQSAQESKRVESAGKIWRSLFVRRWQVCPRSQPWTDVRQFPPISDAQRAHIVAGAQASRLSTAPPDDARVDPGDLLPPGPREHVSCYVLRHLVIEADRKLVLSMGFDDALRVWLDGQLVYARLRTGPAIPAFDHRALTIGAGDHLLLLEVSNDSGPWGLYLSLSGIDGEPLILDREGRLHDWRAVWGLQSPGPGERWLLEFPEH